MRRFLLILLALLVILAGGGYYYYDNYYTAAQEPETPGVRTTTVRRGELIVSASGVGAVIPAAEVNLGFRTGGILAELPVQVGSKVEAGDLLGRVEDTDAQIQVTQAEISLRQTELQLLQLTEAATPAELAAAQATLASAQANLENLLAPPTDEELAAARNNLLSAQQSLNTLLTGPSDADLASAKADVELATIAVQQAQTDYDAASWRPNIGELPQAAALQEATIAYERAQANYDSQAAGATAEQISAARASVASAQSQLDDLQAGSTEQEVAAAQAQLDQAQAQLDAVLEGATAIELELAQLTIDQVQTDLNLAQAQLEGTRLTAPFAGTVMSIDAQVGENVGTTPFISLADLRQPLLEIYLDETDLDKVGLDYEVDVIFDALPDETFTGHVAQVDPALSDISGVSTVRALVQLDADSFAKPQSLPIGLNASVDVIGGRASGALLVPVEALRELSPGQYSVFVMEDGEPKLRMVEVGLMDFTYAEITNGLEQGDIVTTGIVETN